MLAPSPLPTCNRGCRAAVLACALEIIDRDGVDALSMRRLGEARVAQWRDRWDALGIFTPAAP